MRILGLVHQYIPHRCAGAETHMHSMLRALAARGHRVDVVLSAQPGDPYVLDGVHVWPTIDAKRDVFDWLPDVEILISHLDNTTRATVLGQFNAIPVALVHHNDFDVTKEAIRLHMGRVDLIAVNSEWMGEDLTDYCIDQKMLRPTTVVVRPVADRAEFETTPGDRVTLINLRRRDSAKDRDHLTKGGEIFRALAERMPDVRFLGVTGTYGTQQDMSGLDNVEVLDHVPHHGMRDNVYARTKILLVPSSYESWGRVASEAMVSGIPVIARPTPGLVEQLGDAGIFVDSDDPAAWDKAVATLLDHPDRFIATSAAARRRSLELERLGRDDLARWCEAVESAVIQSPRALVP